METMDLRAQTCRRPLKHPTPEQETQIRLQTM